MKMKKRERKSQGEGSGGCVQRNGSYGEKGKKVGGGGGGGGRCDEEGKLF